MKKLSIVLIVLTAALFIATPAAHAAFAAPAAGQFCYASVTTGSTLNCALTNNATAGNVVVATGITFQALTATVADNNSNALTCTSKNTFDSTAGTAVLCWYIAPANAGKTFTMTLTGGTCGACSIRIDEFAVSGGTASLDGSVVTGSGSTQAITAPTITPAGSGTLLVGICADADRCGAVGGSWTLESNGAGSFFEATEYQLSASAATAMSFAGNSAANWDTVGAAFKITAGGVTPPVMKKPVVM